MVNASEANKATEANNFSKTMTQLFTANLNETILNGMYGAYLAQLLDEDWATAQDTDLFRQGMIAYNNHNVAVTMNYITQQALDAFAFIKGFEGDKDVKALYKARLALIDMYEALIGADLDVAIINELVEDIRTQVRRDVMGGLRADATYTIDEADALLADYWYFITDGAVGTENENLFYGANQLTKDGVPTTPETLVVTEDLTTNDTVDALNALFEAK